jgi:hypothetical protein
LLYWLSACSARRERDAAVEQDKQDRAELANVTATHGFSLEAFVAALLRAPSKKPSGPAPSGEHVNRDTAKGLRGAGFKVDARDVRRIRQLMERYNPEILPEALRSASARRDISSTGSSMGASLTTGNP